MNGIYLSIVHFFSFHLSQKDLGDQEETMKQIIIDKLLLLL